MPEMPAPRPGERAAQIRVLRDKYPELSQAAIARRVGCSEPNVTQVLKNYLKDMPVEELAEFQADESRILDALRHRTLSSITEADFEKASLLQKVTASAILMDKSRLLQGQPTSIHVHALMDVASMIREKRDAGQLARQVVTPPDAADLCDMQAGSDDE